MSGWVLVAVLAVVLVYALVFGLCAAAADVDRALDVEYGEWCDDTEVAS